jgi:tRNA (guanine37-N1)-methyltransferase
LSSGDHARITRWRREAALRRTFQRRPDMLLKLALSDEDKQYLAKVAEEETEDPGPQTSDPKAGD